MNRWTLLKHQLTKSNKLDFHYDFLLENGEDCLTWKLSILPQLDEKPVEIFKQPNHRLIWLTRNKYKLSRDRGYVNKIDSGTYKLIYEDLKCDNFSLLLKGNLINAFFKKIDNLCYLVSLD